MGGLESGNTSQEEDPKVPESGALCTFCDQYLPTSVYQRLLVQGVGGAVPCPTQGCNAVAHLRSVASGGCLVVFHSKWLV